MKLLSLILPMLMLAAPLCAQETYTPWIGKVNGDSVRLRSGPSMQHPPIHVLTRGDEVTAVGAKDGFVIVRLPAAAPCWISADLVNPSADGLTLTVTGDKVNLRCTADTKFFAIGQVEKGAQLTAVLDGQTGKAATENGFIRITPPEQATGAVSADFVDKVRDIEAAKPQVEQPAAETKPAADTKPRKEVSPQELADEQKAFAALEGLLRDELAKPAIEVNLTGIRKLFEQFVDHALDAAVSEKASAHIARIDATVKLIEAEKQRIDAENAARLAELEKLRDAALHREEPKAEEPKGPVEYLTTGTLGATGKSAKTPASHRLFDAEGKVLFDLRWDKGDLAKLMGCKVGVVGTVKEYPGWAFKVIVIERIDVLSDEEEK